jgi:hypothetical protein
MFYVQAPRSPGRNNGEELSLLYEVEYPSGFSGNASVGVIFNLFVAFY